MSAIGSLLVFKTYNEAIASFDEVKTALNVYFAARHNVIVERARFNRRRQNPGESLDTFIQDLYRLAENCEYGTLKDELVDHKRLFLLSIHCFYSNDPNCNKNVCVRRAMLRNVASI